MLKFVLFGFVGLVVLLAGYIRLAPLDADVVYVDPETAERPSVPGHFLVRKGGDMEPPVFDMSAADLSNRLGQIIMSTPRTRRLDSGFSAKHATYVTRSLFWGFPDIASVKVIDLGAGQSSVNILSRLYFGQADFAVNETRVRDWLSQI